MSERRVVIYGGGASALAAAATLLEAGRAVDLVGPLPATQWPAPEEGGLQGGDDPDMLVADSLSCSDGLAQPAALTAMAHAAPAIVSSLVRLGVGFDGEASSRLPGSRGDDAWCVPSGTRRAVVAALEGQLRRLSQGWPSALTRYEHHELVSLAVDDQRLHGCIIRDRASGELSALPTATVILCGGGIGSLWSSADELLVERGLAVALRAGAVLAHADLVHHTPCALWTDRPRLRILSDRWRAESARFWLPDDPAELRESNEIPKRDREHLLDESHPGWGALVPDDIAARALHRACVSEGRGIYDARRQTNLPAAYLDVTHLPATHLRAVLGSELDICTLLSRREPQRVALRVAARAAWTLGGLWVDLVADEGVVDRDSARNHATSIDGLYAVDEGCHLYHGRCRMGGNGLLAELFAARCAARSADVHAAAGTTMREEALRAELAREERRFGDTSGAGERNRHELHAELRAVLEGALGPAEEEPGAALAEVEALRADALASGTPATDPLSVGWHHEQLLALDLARAMLSSRIARGEGRSMPLLMAKGEVLEPLGEVQSRVLGELVTRHAAERVPIGPRDYATPEADE